MRHDKMGEPRVQGPTFGADFTGISWNIHRGRGSDGRIDPARVAATLRGEIWRPGVDALHLQEADAEAPPHHGVLDISAVEEITGLKYLHAPGSTRSTRQSHGFLGCITFLHPDIQVIDLRLIDLPGVHPRGAVVVEAVRQGQRFRLCNTHLSLGQALRIAQMRTLAQHLCRSAPCPAILLGDFNEWRPWGGLAFSSRLLGLKLHGPTRATFPVQRPILPLDRVMVDPSCEVTRLDVLDGPGIRAASDHRPLLAQIALPRDSAP